jgi:copper chaperone CopZ
MKVVRILTIAMMIGTCASTVPAWAAEQKVTLMLGGKFCEFYPDAIDKALKNVPGVTAVDLKSMKGHAIVTTDGKAKPDQLTSAVNGVKGDGWHCKADVMK